jgi:hypothetical protein
VRNDIQIENQNNDVKNKDKDFASIKRGKEKAFG